MEKKTTELNNELGGLKKTDLSRWLKDRKKKKTTFGQYLQDLCEKYGTNASRLSDISGVSRAHLYNVKNDQKVLSRKKVIQIGIGLGATKEEIDKLLKYAGHKELYPRKIWDSIIIYGLNNKLNSYQINELLLENDEGDLLNAEK